MKKHYLIVANGEFLVKEIILEAMQAKIVVAVDGAANKLQQLGIKPDVILGDFDSIENAEYWGIHQTFDEMSNCMIPYLGADGVLIVPRKNQDLPDIVKAIQYCDQQGACSITLICALGGRLDLHETTLRSLRQQYKRHRRITLHTEQHTIEFANDETMQIAGAVGDNCAVLAYPQGELSSAGLKYAVANHDLSAADSICNTLVATNATVTIKGEALVIMPPALQAQRDFMQHSESERLRLLLRDLQA